MKVVQRDRLSIGNKVASEHGERDVAKALESEVHLGSARERHHELTRWVRKSTGCFRWVPHHTVLDEIGKV